MNGVELRKLGTFSEMKYGKMPKKDRITEDGQYPIYSGYRIVGYYNEYNLEHPTLIVVARGVGGTGDVKISPAKCYLTNLSIYVDVDESVALKEYLYYYFQIHNLRYLDSGSAQSQITIADLKNVEVPIPTLETQDKVVSILKSLDNKIANNEAINRNLWDQIDSWFYKLNTSDNVVSMKFGDVVTRCSEKVKDDIVKVLSPVSTGEIVLSEDFFTKQVFSNDIGKYLKVNPFEYCYNPARANIGSIGMNDFEFAGCVSPVYVVFKTTDVLRFYMSRYFKTDNFKAEVIIRSSGSVRQALRYEDLVQIEFRKPLDFELEEFNEFYLGLKMQIESLKKENERLSDLRDCMLPRLMSGELDVSELDI